MQTKDQTIQPQVMFQMKYEEGFHDGYQQAMREMPEIVRCKDCRNSVQLDNSNYFVCSKPFASNRETHTADWFCADGKIKEV